ncbi:MAG: secretin N-terminal domain-containing protein [Pseudomonadota bacterium]
MYIFKQNDKLNKAVGSTLSIQKRPALLARGWGALFAVMLVSACASNYTRKANVYAEQGEWIKAVLEYRAARAQYPGDVEFRSRLEQTELKAAEYYYHKGLKSAEKGEFDSAAQQYEQGLIAMPEHSKLKAAVNDVARRREAEGLYQEGERLAQAGKQRDALRLYARALSLVPGHKATLEAKNELEQKLRLSTHTDTPNFGSKAPVTLNFRNTDLRAAFEFIGKSCGVNVIFDEAVKGGGITLHAKGVIFDQALNLMLKTTKTFHKRVGDNTLIVIPDTPDKRRQYDEYVVRTFFLNSIRAKEMFDIVKGLIKVSSVIVNEKMNSLMVRDTADVMALIAKLVDASDRVPAELLMEVEILEINRSKAERLGLDFGGYQIGASIPSSEVIPFGANIPNVYGSRATLSLPALTFRFYKQDVDAKVLANPKIRVLNAKSAKIHIGDRVPLRASTITDATGQVRTTYDYKEIGIRLVVDPLINLDNSVEVKLGLEVSTLGENIGTAEESAFRIGTRNADTYMLLRDGETAILGGLIRDEERNTRVRLPGLGDIPILGALFSNFDNSGGRTDVLLTITPHIVRGWDLPRADLREFFSGSADNYMTRSLYDNAPDTLTNETPPALTAAPAVRAPAEESPADSAQAPLAFPTLGFQHAVYEVAAGEQIEIGLTAEGLASGATVTWELVYDKSLLTYLKAEGTGIKQFAPEAKEAGVVRISGVVDNAGGAPITRLLFRAEKPGIAYLVYRAPTVTPASGGGPLVPRIQAARVVVR